MYGGSTETIPHPGREEIQLAAVLHALSDPVRLKMVASLAITEREAPCGSFDVPVTKSTCTHHFRVLREAGVICQRQEGTFVAEGALDQAFERAPASTGCATRISTRASQGCSSRSFRPPGPRTTAAEGRPPKATPGS